MEAIYLLLPLALVVSAIAVGAFLWALRRGQFEDLSSPAYRMLEEDRHGTAKGHEHPVAGARRQRAVAPR